MYLKVYRLIVTILLLIILLPSAGRAADPVSSLLVIKGSLQQVQQMLSGLLIGADAVLASKIEAASNETSRLLKQVGELEKQANYDANDLVDEVVRPLSLLMPQVREIVTSTERRTFLDLNVAMAGLMQTVDALPLTNVDPFVGAVGPTRIPAQPVDRRIVIYGWLGKPNKDYPVKARLAGNPVALKRVPGGYAFELPPLAPGFKLVEEQWLKLEVDVPQTTNSFLFKRTKYGTITDRIYVQKSEPYGCSYVAFLPNPDYVATVDADQTYHDDARTQNNGGRPSQHRTVAASDLFTATVSTSAQFDPASAKILEPRANIYGASPCEHAGWSGRVVRWNADLIEYALNAPEIGPHWHDTTEMKCVIGICTNVPGGYLHGGGGSHADIDLRPRFSANRKKVPQALEQPPQAFRLRRSETREIPLALEGDAWKVHVKCDYKDGDETFSTGAMILKAADPEEAGRDISARFADGKLYVLSLR